MSYTKGTINNIEQFPGGVIAAKVNGTASGAEVSGWGGYYLTSDPDFSDTLIAASLSGGTVTIFGTEAAGSGSFSTYETIAQVHLPGA